MRIVRAALGRMAQGHGAGAAASGAVHLLVLILVLLSPPVLYRTPAPGGAAEGAIGVRLFTVAGENALTDAPLNEPLLGAEAASSASGASGQAEGDADASRAAAAPAGSEEPGDATPASGDAPPAQTETPPPPPEPEPVRPDPETPAPPVLAAPGGTGAPAENPVNPEPEPVTPPAPSASPPVGPAGPEIADPVITTDGAERNAPVRRAGRVTFADIESRARNPVTVANFTIQELEGLIQLAVQESFCLSSSRANLDAADCGDAPNPLSAELARYGLTRLGETYPTFLEDLSRIEFELQQLGAEGSTIERILAGMREARRQALDEPALTRRMREDEAQRSTDNFGIGGLPPSAPDPSGGG